MEQKYAEYAVQKAAELLAIDSPTGFTDQAAAWVLDTFGALGFDAKKTAKGGVLVDLGGDASDEGALLLQAHPDTLGAMVAEVKANGREALVPDRQFRRWKVEPSQPRLPGTAAAGRRGLGKAWPRAAYHAPY